MQAGPAGGQQQVATLVKTVSAPGTMGGAPSVTIPVSAISVGLPQVKINLQLISLNYYHHVTLLLSSVIIIFNYFCEFIMLTNP